MITSLRPITELHVSSDIIHYGSFPGLVRKTPQRFEISQQNAQNIVTNNDWKFSEENSTKIYFNLIIPGKQQSPMHIEGTKLDSFVFPKWGGISIYNVNHTQYLVLTAQDLKQSFQIFQAQLRMFLGLSPRVKKISKFDVLWLNSDVGISIWEMDGLIRSYVKGYLETSVHTLKALFQVSQEMPNVPISEIVASKTSHSISAVRNALKLVSDGNWSDALVASTTAFKQSESAFFDSSMLTELFVSDYQKMAIYMPLFLPFGITVFMALLRKLKKSRQVTK
jgi:hypothetical protein